MTSEPPRRVVRALLIMIVAILLLYSGLSIAVNVIPATLAEGGSIDFHVFWTYGHFVRMGQDPFEAFLHNRQLTEPVKYLDRSEPIAPPTFPVNWPKNPNLTAPGVLLMSVFSFFSWPAAKLLWLICNLLIVLATPWILIRLLPNGRGLPLLHKLLIFGVYLSIQGTRAGIGVGQTTPAVLLLMLSSLLLRKRNGLVSGLLLGIALSKYSVCIPVFLLLLLDRRFRVLLISLAVQLAGTAAVALLGRGTLLTGFEAYLRLIRIQAGGAGIHLAGVAPGLGSVGAAVLMTLLTAALLAWAARSRSLWRDSADSRLGLGQSHLLAILILWLTLAAYHRLYDTALLLPVVGIVVCALSDPSGWSLSRNQMVGLAVFFAALCAVLCAPSETIRGLLPSGLRAQWASAFEAATTVSMLLSLGVVSWLLRKAGRPGQQALPAPGPAAGQ